MAAVPASGTVNVTPQVNAAIALSSAFSRKIHGGAGKQDIPIDLSQGIGGLVTVEPRTIGSGHNIVFQFDQTVSVEGTATVVDTAGSPMGSTTVAISGSEVTVTLTGIADNQRATVSLAGVNGTLNVTASIGFLVGDGNSTRSVNATDVTAVKTRNGQAVTGANFKYDVNASGSITAADVSAVKARVGLVLP